MRAAAEVTLTIRPEPCAAMTRPAVAIASAIARTFTSPYRYQVMRRLDRARRLLQNGASLAEAAAISGFADQSHMTRQFKKAYGIAPGRWQRATSLL